MGPWVLLGLALLGAAAGQAAIPGCPVSLGCSEFTLNCVAGRCTCRPQFQDNTCSTHFFQVRPDLFNGYYSMSMVLSVLGLLLGVFLTLYYFCRFVPKTKQHNAQIVAIAMITIASLLRLIEAGVALGFGSSVVANYFYRQPNAVQGVLRYSARLYYPLALGALTMQVLLWVEFVLAVKSLKPVSATWSPRLRVILYIGLAFLFLLEGITQALLLFNISNEVVGYVYRALFSAYIVALLLMTAVFSIRLYQVLRVDSSLSSKLSTRARASRTSITRLVLASCALVLIGLCFAISDVAFRISENFGIFWPFIYIERMLEMALVLSILMTALAMMRNRIAYSTASIPDSPGDFELYSGSSSSGGGSGGHTSMVAGAGRSSGKKSGTRGASMRSSGKDAGELGQPLMDYSGFGSAIEDDEASAEAAATTPLRITAQTVPKSERKLTEGAMPVMLDVPQPGVPAYVFQVGELAWAQYRMDGLWYAVKVESVRRDELSVEYLDYGLNDTLPLSSVCPDYNGYLTGDRLSPIKAFDSRPSEEQLRDSTASAPVQPDTFGLVRLRGRNSKKPNHASLLLRRGSVK